MAAVLFEIAFKEYICLQKQIATVMAQTPYIFTQLIKLLPKDYFDRLVKKSGGVSHIKSFSYWNHLLVMIWAHLTDRKGWRDIESSLRVHSDKLFRMGIGRVASRNNLSYSNANRNVGVFRQMAEKMMGLASSLRVSDPLLNDISAGLGVDGFYAIDSSTVSLDIRRFGWSVPQEGVGGIKLHTMFDLMRKVPASCLITGHEERDQTFMDDYLYRQNCFYVMDKMYVKTASLYNIHIHNAYFIVRRKRNIVCTNVRQNHADGVLILSDRIIRFSSRWASKGYPEELRLISYYCPEKNETLEFMTNNLDADAATVALLYAYRWEIELFFKWIKQHLHITRFYGSSGNAVMIQVYCGIIAYCLLAIAKEGLGFKESLYEFSRIINSVLTEKAWLRDVICRYETAEANMPEDEHPTLF